jgi:hypothetical protein
MRKERVNDRNRKKRYYIYVEGPRKVNSDRERKKERKKRKKQTNKQRRKERKKERKNKTEPKSYDEKEREIEWNDFYWKNAFEEIGFYLFFYLRKI